MDMQLDLYGTILVSVNALINMRVLRARLKNRAQWMTAQVIVVTSTAAGMGRSRARTQKAAVVIVTLDSLEVDANVRLGAATKFGAFVVGVLLDKSKDLLRMMTARVLVLTNARIWIITPWIEVEEFGISAWTNPILPLQLKAGRL